MIRKTLFYSVVGTVLGYLALQTFFACGGLYQTFTEDIKVSRAIVNLADGESALENAVNIGLVLPHRIKVDMDNR